MSITYHLEKIDRLLNASLTEFPPNENNKRREIISLTHLIGPRKTTTNRVNRCCDEHQNWNGKTYLHSPGNESLPRKAYTSAVHRPVRKLRKSFWVKRNNQRLMLVELSKQSPPSRRRPRSDLRHSAHFMCRFIMMFNGHLLDFHVNFSFVRERRLSLNYPSFAQFVEEIAFENFLAKLISLDDKYRYRITRQ